MQCQPGKYSNGTVSALIYRRECLACGQGTLQPYHGQTRCIEASPGVSDTAPDQILVDAGFYRPANASIYTSLTPASGRWSLAVPCPWGSEACLGGSVGGDASCAEGHHGVFCASCQSPTHFRGSSSCRACPSSTTQAATVTVVLGVAALVVLAAMAMYLQTATRTAPMGTKSLPSLATCLPRIARAVSRLPPSTHRQASAVIKIVMGLAQCLSTVRSFGRVNWPTSFIFFIDSIDRFSVLQEGLSAITTPLTQPVHCMYTRLCMAAHRLCIVAHRLCIAMLCRSRLSRSCRSSASPAPASASTTSL